jgi:hypothetical protein
MKTARVVPTEDARLADYVGHSRIMNGEQLTLKGLV